MQCPGARYLHDLDLTLTRPLPFPAIKHNVLMNTHNVIMTVTLLTDLCYTLLLNLPDYIKTNNNNVIV